MGDCNTLTFKSIIKMKKFIFSLLATLSVICVNAQNSGFMFDTIETSSSIDTVDLYPGYSNEGGTVNGTYSKLFKPGGTFTCYCEADSLSGSTNATMYLQYGHTSSPTIWYNKTTTTLNGAAVITAYTHSAPLGFDRVRVRSISASGTQNTRVRCSWGYDPEVNY